MYKMQMAAGGLALLAGILLTYLEVLPEDPSAPLWYLTPPGLVLIIIPLARHLRYGDEPYKDERTNNILTRGFAYSYQITIGVMVALFLVEDMGVLTMTAQKALAIIILVATLSAIFFRWYLFRKEAMACGDQEEAV